MLNNFTHILSNPKLRAFALEKFSTTKSRDSFTPLWLGNFLYAALLVAYVVFMLVYQHKFIFSGEMYAEMATIYFPAAHSPDWTVKFFATDAGYIPLLPHIIMAIIVSLGIKASMMPYIMTWSAIILSPMLAGIFCLPFFRSLIPNDITRFLVSVSILFFADFQARSFINFTYFGIFFVSVLLAAALNPRSDDAPGWAWVMPILMLSKPYILAVLPIMVLVVMIGKPKFRQISIISIILGIIQICQLVISNQHKQMEGYSLVDASLWDKVHATVLHFSKLLGFYPVGFPILVYNISPFLSIIMGIFFLAILMLVLIKVRNPALTLIIVGLCLFAGNIFINCFAVSFIWSLKAVYGSFLSHILRHAIGIHTGIVLIIIGLLQIAADKTNTKPGSIKRFLFSTANLYLFWLILTRWPVYGLNLSQYTPPFPILGSGNWQQLSDTIDSSSTYCVPIDPYPWFYGRHCIRLYDINMEHYKVISLPSGQEENVILPPDISNMPILAVGLVIAPSTHTTQLVNIKIKFETKEGKVFLFTGQKQVNSSGGFILATGDPAWQPMTGIAKATFLLDKAVQINTPSDLPDHAQLVWFAESSTDTVIKDMPVGWQR